MVYSDRVVDGHGVRGKVGRCNFNQQVTLPGAQLRRTWRGDRGASRGSDFVSFDNHRPLHQMQLCMPLVNRI